MSHIDGIPIKFNILKSSIESIKRIKYLFAYKLPSEENDCPRPVYIEVGGGSTHAVVYFDDRSEADMFCDYLVKMLERRSERQKTELKKLCAEYLKESEL